MTWFLSSVVVPILVIGVLILVHELGHFLVAKWCGVGVVKFSIGFGPALLKWKRAETVYQLSAIPLGGFVRMVGDVPDMITGAQATDDAVRGDETDAEKVAEDDEVPPELLADHSKWFVEKGFWQRFAIVFAGPASNFIFAVLFVFAVVAIYGEEVPEETAVIGIVMPGSPAEKAGVLPGDHVHALNGEAISSWEELALKIQRGDGGELKLDVERGGERKVVEVTPKKREIRTLRGEKKPVYLIGIQQKTERRSAALTTAAKVGVLWTYHQAYLTYAGLWGMVSGVVAPSELAGPLFIFNAAGKEARKGFENILLFMSVLSVSLGVLNLLPIPILDGGHLMFFVLEALMGPIAMRKKEFAQQIGFMLLMLLMGFAITNDIRRDPKASPDNVNFEESSAASAPAK